MRKLMIVAATAATLLATPALAGSPDGRWQVKLLATGVLPDGKIDKVETIDAGTALGGAVAATAGPQTRVNDNVVPTLAVEYYFTPNVSVETICCLTQHHVSGAGGLAGTRLVDHVLILPATVTAKYHLNLGPIRPYVGAGPAAFLVFGEKPGATARALGTDKMKLSNELGVVVQGGVDVPLGDSGMGISLDAKKYWIGTTATFQDAAGAATLATKLKLDPWVVSGGVYFRF